MYTTSGAWIQNTEHDYSITCKRLHHYTSSSRG